VIPAACPSIGDEEREAVDRVLRSGMLAQGPEVEAFEREFAGLIDGFECVAVNSVTSALHLALIAAGVNAGDQVIVPSFTFAATANAVVLAGGIPVFVDIDPATFCLDPGAVKAAVTSRTRGIVPVHLYGHPADMDAISLIAKEHDLFVVEDAAQAHGASVNGKPVGSLGDAGSFSFYPTKNMTSGEGGMVTTSRSELARQVRLLRNQGMQERYRNEIVGYNNRMTDVHASIGRVQLRKLPTWTARRKAIAARYDAELHNVKPPLVATGAGHVYHQYTVRIEDDRDGFAQALFDRGVGTGIYYPTPVHRLPSFNLDVDLPQTNRAAAEVLSLPVYPALTDAQVDLVIDAVNDVAKAGS
jgi:perosamine synthetase